MASVASLPLLLRFPHQKIYRMIQCCSPGHSWTLPPPYYRLFYLCFVHRKRVVGFLRKSNVVSQNLGSYRFGGENSHSGPTMASSQPDSAPAFWTFQYDADGPRVAAPRRRRGSGTLKTGTPVEGREMRRGAEEVRTNAGS
jgi:hypothetical protein